MRNPNSIPPGWSCKVAADRRWWTILVGSVAFAACRVLDHSCTEAGCQDGVNVAIRADDGSWPDGSYALTLTIQGTAHTCEMTLPDDLPASGSLSEIACNPALGHSGASLRQDASCSERRTEDAISESCEPIPGSYALELFVAQTPERIGVSLTRDDSTLVARDVEVEYVLNFPNGEDCEPVCRNATVEIEIE